MFVITRGFGGQDERLAIISADDSVDYTIEYEHYHERVLKTKISTNPAVAGTDVLCGGHAGGRTMSEGKQ